MQRDAAQTEQLQKLISKIETLTKSGELHWERRLGSAHRYAQWNNNLLILGPAAPLSDTHVARYLFVTPFDSPNCIELNSEDEKIGPLVLKLAHEVETASSNEPPTDPFAINQDWLERLEGL